MDKLGINKKQKLLLHVCCAPCSSHVLEVLFEQFDITAFFYNPNITEEVEYKKRINELQKFVAVADFAKDVKIVDGLFSPEIFFEMSKGLEAEPERGSRCYKCYEQRMRKSADFAAENNFDIFTTTLSISPHKNAKWINEIGERLAREYHIEYMYSDFKKKNGYARSIQLSKEYDLYRQDYCGCIYSKRENDERRAKILLVDSEKI